MADLNDFNKPDGTTSYLNDIWDTVRGMFARLAKMDYTGASNIPVGAKRVAKPATGEIQVYEKTALSEAVIFDSRDKLAAAAVNANQAALLAAANNAAARAALGLGGCSFDASNSAGRTTSGTFVTFTEVEDTGAVFNPTTGIFTAPVAGLYVFAAAFDSSGTFSGAAPQFNAFLIDKGGVNIGVNAKASYLVNAQGSVRTVTLTAIQRLALGDTISMSTVMQAAGTTTNCIRFQGALIA